MAAKGVAGLRDEGWGTLADLAVEAAELTDGATADSIADFILAYPPEAYWQTQLAPLLDDLAASVS